MLVLSRKPGESIVIGDNTVITVLRSSDHQVRIGIAAPRELSIARAELIDTKTGEQPGQSDE